MSYLLDDLMNYEMEKTAVPADLAILGERIYESKGKLKDLAFGKVKDGEAKGNNRFNHAYDSHVDRHAKQFVGQMFGDSPKKLKEQDDVLKGVARKATWQAAKRPLIASAGLAAAGIYGGHKLKAARAKRLVELEEKNPPRPEQKERLKKELRHSNLRRLGTAGLIAGGYGSIGPAANKMNKNINELKEHYRDVPGIQEWHPGFDEWAFNDEKRKKQEQFAEKANKNIKNFENRTSLGKGFMIGGAALGAYDGYRRIKARRAYRKSLEPMQDQEKTALLSDPDNLWKDQSKPPTLLNALKPKKPHGTTGTVPDYVKGTGRKQPSPLTDLINSRKRY